jgi:hypothetical protein
MTASPDGPNDATPITQARNRALLDDFSPTFEIVEPKPEP